MSSSSSSIKMIIMSVKPQDSHVQEKLGIAHSNTFTSTMLLPTCMRKKTPKKRSRTNVYLKKFLGMF